MPLADGAVAPTDANAFLARKQAHLVFLFDSADGTLLHARIGDVILGIGATETIAGAGL